jgi:hypothetical protein
MSVIGIGGGRKGGRSNHDVDAADLTAGSGAVSSGNNVAAFDIVGRGEIDLLLVEFV